MNQLDSSRKKVSILHYCNILALERIFTIFCSSLLRLAQLYFIRGLKLVLLINLYLKDLFLYGAPFILLPIFLVNIAIVPQENLSLLMAQGQQQGQDNASATDMENLTKTIIPQAEEVNEANSQLIKICADSPNSECDNTMIAIYNDCKAYPAYVATHIPSCGDSRLLSYLLVRELLG
jgi:hypothetical protein